MKWHKGPPPSVGWWPTTAGDYPEPHIEWLRWWDGKYWSAPAAVGQSAVAAANAVRYRSAFQEEMHWTGRPDSWPARSKT